MASDLEAALKLAKMAEGDAETDDAYELASRTLPALVAELRIARDKLAAVQRLLSASPFGPTRAQAVATLFEIRLVATDEFDRAGER